MQTLTLAAGGGAETGRRYWLGHDSARWERFQRRCRVELKHKVGLIDELRQIARERPLTLVYSAHDEAHNQAVALRGVLLH